MKFRDFLATLSPETGPHGSSAAASVENRIWITRIGMQRADASSGRAGAASVYLLTYEKEKRFLLARHTL